MALQTRKVFIDTQSFVKAGLDFRSRSIKSFSDACEGGELIHIMTTVVENEVRDKIKDHIKEALGKFQEFKRKAKILEGSTDPIISGLFAQFDSENIENQALTVFREFMTRSGTTTINLSHVDSEEVFRRYFNQEAPFQAGKKKDEFPDAFTLLAIEGSLGEQECCYIVSEDGDLKAFCDGNNRLIQIDSISKLLDLFNSHDDERTKFVKEYFSSQHQAIYKAISDQIESTEFNNVSSWEGSEVVDHDVLDIDHFEIDIIDIDDEQCYATLDTRVHYHVVVEGPDFNNASYDRESGRVYTFDDVTRIEKGALDVTAEIELNFDIKDGKFEVTDMRVNVLGLANGIEVSVEENEWEDPR